MVKLADIAMSMSLEALQGIYSAFRPEIHQLRPFIRANRHRRKYSPVNRKQHVTGSPF
ncbi:MAG: hypothetical protein R3C26_26745 [Calditrichia bacterium]